LGNTLLTYTHILVNLLVLDFIYKSSEVMQIYLDLTGKFGFLPKPDSSIFDEEYLSGQSDSTSRKVCSPSESLLSEDYLDTLVEAEEIADYYLELVGSKCFPGIRQSILDLIKGDHIRLNDEDKTFFPVSPLR